MEKNKRALVRALVLFCVASPALPAAGTGMESYETEVLHRGKFAKPITDFVNTEGKFLMQEQASDQDALRRQLDGIMATAQGQDVNKHVMNMMFPVMPETIKQVTLPGTRIIKSFPALPQPLFIIGDDTFSLQWLQSNKAELERFHAAGIVTKVASKQEFEEIQRLAHPLLLMPMPADALATEMGIPGYPIMITGQGFFQ